MSCGLRDVLSLEMDGLPSVLVASDVFAQAAADQAARLGAPGARRAFVAHPVQDRTDPEMRDMAVALVDELLALLATP